MKRLLFLSVLFAFSFVSGLPVFAASGEIESASFVPSKLIFNGRELNMWQDPLVGIIRRGGGGVQHYMSLKGVLEQMGYIVNFDDSLNIVTVITPGVHPEAHVPSASATSTFASGGIRAAAYNNYTLVMNNAVIDLQDEKIISVLRGTEAHPQFFLPLRPVLEYLGYYVGWDGANNSVIVASDDYFESYGALKPAEPIAAEETEQEGTLPDQEIVDDAENATEPLPGPDLPPEEIIYLSLDESAARAITVLTENLQNPSSLIFHEIRYTDEGRFGFTMYIDFSSRNALGGYVRRIAEVGTDGALIVEGETVVEDGGDNSVYYTAIRLAYQRASTYEEFEE